MSKSKKAIIILLALCFVFLIGCSSSQPNSTPTTKKSTAAQKEPTGFVELDISPVYLQNCQSLCSQDDLAVFMTTVYLDQNGNPYTPSDEDDFGDAKFGEYIVKYDLKKNKLIDMVEIKDCPIKEIWGLELKDNHIIIFSNSEKKNAVYDLDMNFFELNDRVVNDPNDIAKKSQFYNESELQTNPGYSNFDSDNNIKYTYFHNELDSLYIYNTDMTHRISQYNEALDLFLTECYDYDCGTVLDFRVEDFRNAKEINRATIDSADYGYDYGSTGQTGFGNKYALCVVYFNKIESNGFTIKAFSWNYSVDPTNKELSIIKANSLDDLIEVEKLCFKDDYNIDVYINEPCDNIVESVNCNTEPDKIMLYDDLKSIHGFLDSLPEGMVKEIYSGYENDKENAIRLDLVSELTFDAGAFTQSFTDPMELCFPFNNVTSANIAHEFMHLIDERILQTNPNYIDEWAELNKGFEHEYNINEDEHPIYNYDEKQFLTEYSASNDTEDRAELFAYLYNGGGEAYESEMIKTKTEFLIKIIRDSYPSVQSLTTTCWEQNLQQTN